MINRKALLIVLVLLSMKSIAQQTGVVKKKIHIGVVNNHVDKKEFAAMLNLLKKSTNLDYEILDLRKGIATTGLKRFTHIWYHRTDTTDFDQQELKAGGPIKKFVEAGGNLFLSMESVALLNRWGIETAKFGVRRNLLTDDGFGRPAGFHAFKSHPVFEGMNGGTYTTKRKSDHEVRKTGFFEDAVPATGKVLGIDWTYITYSEKNKILLEYNIGKGTIIAAGAYLYYNSDNYNEEHLRRFTENVFLYSAGLLTRDEKHYWNYEPRQFKQAKFDLPKLKPATATRWNLKPPSLNLTKENAGHDFYNLVGKHILWMGTMKGGVEEIWMHPFMALRDLQLGVKKNDSETVYWLKDIPASVEVTPEYFRREYKFRNTIIREVYTVAVNEANGAAHLEIEGDDCDELVVTYGSNLRYMWPYSSESTGTIEYGYNSNINAHLISGQKGALNTVVAYSSSPLFQQVKAEEKAGQVNVRANFSLKGEKAFNIYIMGSSSNLDEAVQLYSNNIAVMNNLHEKTSDYYRGLLKGYLNIHTPDSLFNTGYNWALARINQYQQTTPGIGNSLMAGYGTTRSGWGGNQKISGRPGYAWYFGRDAVFTSMAVNAFGDFPVTKDVLETFIRFQDVNGKIYHELTSSGAVHYDASDATPMFVMLAAHYLKYSGDLEYIRKRWPAFKKALDFCYSTDTDNDGLIENTNVGHGWIEGGIMLGAHSEIYLTGMWAAALDAGAYMAGYLDLPGKEKYAADAKKIKAIIDRDFWNPKENFFYNGKMIDGSYMPYVTVLAGAPVYMGAVTDEKKAEKVSARFNNSQFSASWGIRMVEDSCSFYDPGNYQDGTVRSLDGGIASLAEYTTGHYRSGYQHIFNSLVQYRFWALGSIQEAINGAVFRPNGVCSNQAWSEGMVVQPAIEGMLGLKPDAMKNRLKLTPYFPWDWEFCNVSNIRMKDALLNMDMKRNGDITTYTFNSGKNFMLDFNPVLPLNTTITDVLVNGKKVQYSKIVKPEGISLSFSFPVQKGQNLVEIKTQGGIGVLPVFTDFKPGDSSSNLQVTAERVEGNIYTIQTSGTPEKSYDLKIFTRQDIDKIDGAEIVKLENNLLFLKLRMSEASGKSKYGAREIRIHFN
ncbi:MAG TPA: GH116 family glycosyl hydrolase [Chitinophagaceae bacterium]|nr:GH116 family glycosyl hydrolase [Chitinophagaceae bacterium]